MDDWSAIEERQPWLTFGAIQFLDENISFEMTAFEYGCGGSTLFLASRIREGVSIEHDVLWADRVDAALNRHNLGPWKIEVVIPEAIPDDPLYTSTDSHFTAHSFRAYATAIDRIEDRSLDLVILDGRARVACLQHALEKVKPGGYIVLDNAERAEYAPIHKALTQWHRRDFWGPGPHNLYFWLTSVWRRVED